jgi:RNA polymerase sigma factor (sigma-70 family)
MGVGIIMRNNTKQAQAMAVKYMPKAVIMAKKIYTTNKHIQLDDLIGDAYEALWNACITWDSSKTANQNTYIQRCVRNHLLNCVTRRYCKWRDESLNVPVDDDCYTELIDTIVDDRCESNPIDSELRLILKFALASSDLLSITEKDIVSLMFSGNKQKEIAERLGISNMSVSVAIKKISSKMGSLRQEVLAW